ncbi:hypothetical protein EA462_07850 [Natrarchaeobius halalkaliphilus]|uniref:Uncharacterized protein n=1 Tax=Natrarchaeobius halalkaliphilus TaxID=1679091 RepID=A0A3N6P3M3_9EURY|nr:hypothetical protein EA462_07850 [Natrarchaeobius halalkaliphilus]
MSDPENEQYRAKTDKILQHSRRFPSVEECRRTLPVNPANTRTGAGISQQPATENADATTGSIRITSSLRYGSGDLIVVLFGRQ